MTTLAEALQKASDYHRAGDLARAEPLYRQAVQADPANVAVWRLLGETYQALGRPADAAASCEKALRFKPDYAGQYVRQGGALADQGNYDDAARCRQEVLDHAGQRAAGCLGDYHQQGLKTPRMWVNIKSGHKCLASPARANRLTTAGSRLGTKKRKSKAVFDRAM
jgi:tetratricopeptide (TPR) repeat protein